MKKLKTTDMGFLVKVWGVPGWLFLHSIAQNLPLNSTDEQKKNYLIFFEQIGNVLPCFYCRESYQKFIKEPDTRLDMSVMESREKLAKWLYDIHNKVNKKLEVPKDKIPTFKQVWNRYETYRSKCKKNPEVVEKVVKKGCVDPLKGYRKQCVLKIINIDANGNPIKKTSFGKLKTKKGNKKQIKLISIKKSTKKDKKLMATFEVNGKRRVIHFGANGMSDYRKHRDTKRRGRYIKRHKKDLGTRNPMRAGYLSMFILWNKKSLSASIADYRRRLAIYNRTGKFPSKIK